jgi:glyoxylase-like metal-dependent hydrolase (beta-lactamase superfamily II)
LDCVTAVLAAWSGDIPELLTVIRSISDKPIKYVLASHYHGDHNGGIGEMIKLGATVVVNDSLRDAYDLSKREGTSPKVTFGNFGTIQLGGVRVGELVQTKPPACAGGFIQFARRILIG